MSQRFSRQVWRLLPGGVAAVAMLLLLKLNALQTFEQTAYRQLFQVRGALTWDDRIVVVAIDDLSIKQIGRFPWSRQSYTQLLNVLSQAQSSVVVMDLLWSEPSPQDAQLAAAMSRQGHVVLAQAWDNTGRPLLPVPQLAAAAIGTGHVMKRQDSDGIVRQVDLQVNGQPALAVVAAQVYSLVEAPISLPALDQPFWVNWVSPANQPPTYSFVDVVQGNVSPQALQNKIVLVGATATALDTLVTPFNRNPPTSSVYLQATVLHNLLRHNWLKPLNGVAFWWLLLLSAPGLSWFMTGWNTRQQLAAITGLVAGWAGLGVLLFQLNYWLPIVPPMAVFVATTLAVALSDRLRENYLLRRQVAHLWRYYHPEPVGEVVVPPPLPLALPETLTQPQGVISQVVQLTTLAEQLGRAQATQAAIAHTLPVGLLAADLDGAVWFCNPIASQLLQIRSGSNLNHQIAPAWLPTEQWQTSLEALQVGVPVKHSNLQRGDRWFDLVLQPLTYPSLTLDTPSHRQSKGFLLLLEDITDHKQVEVELQQAREIAVREAARSESASRAKSEFLANMSHELRTPLNVILGFTQIMGRDHSLSLEHQKNLGIINRSGQHLLGLINDVLEMSKIEAGRSRLHETSFDLHHLLADLEAMLRVRAVAKQLRLTFHCAPEVCQYIVSDEGKLRQVLLNLVGNAVKFTEAGQVTLWVKAEGRSANAMILSFEVEDSGPGIPPEELQQLFQPFVQAQAGQRSREGTGLGLAISQKFVNLMEGVIQVCSSVGKGSTFKFQIPVKLAATNDIPLPVTTDRVVALAPDQPNYRILVAEDQPESSQLLVKMLSPLGFEVREVNDGQAAVNLWRKWQPHLILMDMRMPIMTGLEATQQIRAIEQQMMNDWANRTQSLPLTQIIALTASVFEETKTEAIALGCDAFLRKPVQEQVLLTQLAQCLGVRFIYESAPVGEQPGNEQGHDTLRLESQQQLKQMSPAWVEKLRYAAAIGSDRLLLQLIEQIPSSYVSLMQQLTQLSENFEFDAILELITDSRES